MADLHLPCLFLLKSSFSRDANIFFSQKELSKQIDETTSNAIDSLTEEELAVSIVFDLRHDKTKKIPCFPRSRGG